MCIGKTDIIVSFIATFVWISMLTLENHFILLAYYKMN